MGSAQSTTNYINELDAIDAKQARDAMSTTTLSTPPLEELVFIFKKRFEQ